MFVQLLAMLNYVAEKICRFAYFDDHKKEMTIMTNDKKRKIFRFAYYDDHKKEMTNAKKEKYAGLLIMTITRKK